MKTPRRQGAKENALRAEGAEDAEAVGWATGLRGKERDLGR